MDYLTNKLKEKIVCHSLQEYPDECCGLVVKHKTNKRVYIRKCKNVSLNKENNFEISSSEYLKAESTGKIIAYYHSHPHDDIGTFSEAEKKVSLGHGLPLIMYCVKNKKFLEYKA